MSMSDAVPVLKERIFKNKKWDLILLQGDSSGWFSAASQNSYTANILQVFCFLKCFPYLLVVWKFPFSSRTYLTPSLNSKLLQKPFGNSDGLSNMFSLEKIRKIQVKHKLKHSMTGNVWAWQKGILFKKNSTCTNMHFFLPFIHYLYKTALDIFWHMRHSLRNTVWGHIS